MPMEHRRQRFLPKETLLVAWVLERERRMSQMLSWVRFAAGETLPEIQLREEKRV